MFSINPTCENCNGRGFIITRMKEENETAINSKLIYDPCPICKGSGEKPFNDMNEVFEWLAL